MAQACNPSTLGGRGGWITRSTDREHPGQHGETPSLLKITKKISWAWWLMPVIPATREAEAGELAEPRRRRLRWAEIAPLHSSLGNKSETLCQKNKKGREMTQIIYITNERRNITTDPTDIKRMIKGCYEQPCAHKVNNLNKMGQFLERHNLLKLIKRNRQSA